MNKVAEELTGWSEQEARGEPIGRVWEIRDYERGGPVETALSHVLDGGNIIGGSEDALLVSRGGRPSHVSYSIARIQDREGKVLGAVIAFRDITEKRRVEKELRKAENLESLAVLAGGIAHDFNNLLTGILGNASLARMLAADHPQLSATLEDMEKASLRARGLAQRLLTFSSGGTPVKRAVDLGGLIREVSEFAVHGTPVRCEYRLAEDLLPVEADADQAGQVIHNLVINAVQAMPRGGVVTIAAENARLGPKAPTCCRRANTSGLRWRIPGRASLRSCWARFLTPSSPPSRKAADWDWPCPTPF